MESGPKWQIHSDFPSCSESAEIAMPTLFPWKNVAVFFFHKWGNKASNMFLKVPPSPFPPPPPPPSSNSGHTHAQCFGSQGSKFYIVWRRTEREGGAILSIFFCLGHFFNTNRVDMANFSGFWATWEIATKLSLGAGFPGSIQLSISFRTAHH